MLWPKKNQARNLITKKNSCGSKIPHPPLSNGPSFSDGEVDLGAHSFFPTPHLLKIYLCLVTMAYNILHQTNERQVDELEKTLVSFSISIVCRNPLERGGIEDQDF